MQLQGKHGIVTGGGSGLGAAIAVLLAEAGAQITVMGRREEPLRQQAAHERISWQVCDVTDGEAVGSAFDAARSQNGAIDIVVANAGEAVSKPFAKMNSSDLNAALSVNLVGTFNCFKAALPDMKASGWGRMIAIASTAGLKGYPYVSGYCAAKHGVVGLTRGLAVELGKSGITVNAICPGFIETPMLERSIVNIMSKTGMSEEKAANSLKSGNPQGRFIQPEEVAEAALWLCSEGARSVNGHALSVSGGEI